MIQRLGVFLEQASVDRGDIDFSNLQATLDDWDFYPETTPAEQIDRIRDASVIVNNKLPLTAEAIAASPNLELVCVSATGTNNIDLAAAKERGIVVCNARAYATPAVVQHVFGLILALTTRHAEIRQALKAGDWQRSKQFCLLDFELRELAGRNLGIIGYGELGQAVARVGEAFGMNILVAQRFQGEPDASRLSLDELLQQSDVVSLHCPLSPLTENLIGERELGLMKPDALLINTARGGIVHEGALLDALNRGVIGGAATDVLVDEPPVNGNALLEADLPNLLVTPHVAWATTESRQRLIDQVAENIRAWLAGNPKNLVTHL